MEGNSLLTEMGKKNLELIVDLSRMSWEIFRLFYLSKKARGNHIEAIFTMFSFSCN